MIKDEKVAVQVSESVLEVNRLLNDALRLVQEECSEAEFSEFRHAVGQVLGELLLEIVNPLYRQHPKLKPEGLDIP